MMKKTGVVLLLAVLAVLAVLLLAGCATGAGDDPKVPKVTIRMEQLDNANGNNFETAAPSTYASHST